MQRRHLAAVLVVTFACGSSACRTPPKPRNACVWTLKSPIRGVSEICRDDMTTTTCIARDSDIGPPAFTPDRTCPDVGFACLGDAIDASYRRTKSDGTCAPGMTLSP